MNTCLSTEENSSDKKIKKKCRETILAESIEFLYKISTFLLIKRSTKSQDSSEATPTNQTPFKVFTYLFHTILALNSGRFWLVFINDEARKQDVIVLVLVLTFCNFFIACCIFYRLFCAESFRQLRERLLELEIFTDEKTLIKIYQQSKTSIILHILFGTFISIAFWVLLITLPSKDSFWLIYLSYPVTDVSGKYYYTALVLTMILMFVGSFWTSVSAYIANWLLIFLQKEFDCHAKAFRVDFRLADISMKHHLSVAERSSRIFEMCKAHNNLCDVLESMNFLYRGHFGFSLSIIIALVCLLIYELIHRSTETFEFGFLTCIVISNLIGTIINIKKCIALHLSVSIVQYFKKYFFF